MDEPENNLGKYTFFIVGDGGSSACIYYPDGSLFAIVYRHKHSDESVEADCQKIVDMINEHGNTETGR